MPNRSRANTRRKRLATQKLDRWRGRDADKSQDHRPDHLDQKVGYGVPGNLGSGSQVGSAADSTEEKDAQ